MMSSAPLPPPNNPHQEPERAKPDSEKTYEEIGPNPDTLGGPVGRNVMIFGGVFVAVLTLAISLFALLFAPKTAGTPTPFMTATDRVLAVFNTETPTLLATLTRTPTAAARTDGTATPVR